MEESNVRRPIAEHTNCDAVILIVMIAQRHPGCDGQVCSNDRVSTPEIFLNVGHVHRAALSFGTPGRFTQ